MRVDAVSRHKMDRAAVSGWVQMTELSDPESSSDMTRFD